MWWIVGGIAYGVALLFIMGCCKVADRYDREMGMK
jgi:hypothetical protein